MTAFPNHYVVAAHFAGPDPANPNVLSGGMAVGLVLAVSEAEAAAMHVSSYYRGGGSLPLVGVGCHILDEASARAAVANFDRQHEAERAEAAKVTTLKAVESEP